MFIGEGQRVNGPSSGINFISFKSKFVDQTQNVLNLKKATFFFYFCISNWPWEN